MRFIINLLISAIAVYALSEVLEPHVVIDSFSTAIIFSIVLGILNAIVKPLLIILTLPITIVTIGLFLIVINVIIIKLADAFVSGIHIEGWLWALIFSFLLSLVSALLHKLAKNMK